MSLEREEIRKRKKALKAAGDHLDNLVKDKQNKIASELNLIPESDIFKRSNYLKLERKKNLDEKHQNEINEKLGKPHPFFFIGHYYSKIDKWLIELIDLYEKKIPQIEPIQTENIPKKEAELPKNALNNSSFETPIKAYSPQELPNFLGDYALMQVYLSLSGEGESVTNANKEEIAKKYNCHPRRLYEEYNSFRKENARTEEAGSTRKNEAKAERFNRVIKLLQPFPEALKRATDEQKIFIVASQKSYD